MTPRSGKQVTGESTPPPQQGTPLIPGASQGHDFHTQAVFNIHGQVAKLEIGLNHVEMRLGKVEDKLDEVKLDVHGAKKIAWVFGVVLSAMGAVGLLILNKLLDVALKHYK